jgi:deazaflavin-dependent oxidoreductase (nitroreductase family)
MKPMTDSVRRAAAAEIDKHRRLLRTGRDGRILSALMLPMVVVRPPVGQGVLTTTGRKTGKPRRKVVRPIRDGNRVYLVALRVPNIALERPGFVNAWLLNIRANPRVRLRMRGGTFDGVAREVTDAAEVERARSLFCDNVYPIDYGECLLHLRGMPSRAKIKELHRYWFETGNLVAVDLR